MAEPPLQQAIQVLSVHELDSLQKWEEAAKVVCQAAEAGADLASVLDVLRQAFLESHQLPVMHPLAAALTCHYLTRGDEAGLRVLLADKDFSPYVLQSLDHYHKHGRKVPLALLLAAFPTSDLTRVLAQRCRRQPREVRPILDALWADAAKRSVIGPLVRDLVMDGKLDLSEAVAVVARLVGEPQLRDGGASTLLWLAQANLDLKAALPYLREGLKSECARSCAQSMAHYLGRTQGWTELDGLLTHDNAEVRAGAIQSLGLLLVSEGLDDPELVKRLVTGLTDAEETVRALARCGLSGGQREGRRVDEPPPELTDDVMVEYGYWWMHRSPERTRQLLDGRPLREDLKRTCEEVLRGEHEWACSICKHIPRHVSVSSVYDVPKNVARLEPRARLDESGWRTCPECGNRYFLSFEEEIDDMTVYTTIEVTRQVHPKESRLTHIEPYMREDAAFALRSPELLQHPDVGIRRAALEGFGEATPALLPCLRDPDSVVRTRAAHKVLPGWIERAEVSPLLDLLRTGPEDMTDLVMGYLCPSELDPAPFADAIRAYAAAGRPKAMRAVEWLASRGHEVAAQIQLLEAQLDSAEREVRERALSALESLVEHWPGAPERLARQLGRDQFYSISVLKKAVRYHDLTPCYPALVETVNGGGAYADKAGWLLREALTGHPADLVAALVPGLKHKEQVRHAVMGCYTVLAQAGLDLTPGRAALLEALGTRRPSYVESGFAKDYASYLVDHRDYEALELLLAEADVSGAVSRVLAERPAFDLTPLVPTLQGLVTDRHWWVREGAELALRSRD